MLPTSSSTIIIIIIIIIIIMCYCDILTITTITSQYIDRYEGKSSTWRFVRRGKYSKRFRDYAATLSYRKDHLAKLLFGQSSFEVLKPTRTPLAATVTTSKRKHHGYFIIIIIIIIIIITIIIIIIIKASILTRTATSTTATSTTASGSQDPSR